MANYSHPVRTQNPVSGTNKVQRRENDHLTAIHAAGCAHQARLIDVYPHNLEEAKKYADDYYYVAPCARKAS